MGDREKLRQLPSVSRLLSAQNPETGPSGGSGTTLFKYDPNGNLIEKTDPRTTTQNTVKTYFSYDALNRLYLKTYTGSPGASSVTYCYDGKIGAGSDGAGQCTGTNSVSYSTGKLMEVRAAANKTRYDNFDALGRVLAHAQVTDGISYSFSYGYNRVGLTQMTYPSGRVVRTYYDPAGRTSALGMDRAGVTATVSTWTYAPGGQYSKMNFANSTYIDFSYNSRQQATQQQLWRTGTALGTISALKLSWGYAAATNNGNVAWHDTEMSTAGKSQRFSYDGVNRLKTVQEGPYVPNGGALQTVNWGQTLAYDQQGNRALVQPVNQFIGDGTITPQVSYDTPAQITAAFPQKNQWSGASYDLAGNMTGLPGGRTLAYDSENRLITGTMPTTGTTSYMYDGDGRRVKKIAGVGTTVYVFDVFGTLAAEYSTAPPKELGTRYYMQDPLGSVRAMVDTAGNPRRLTDYAPFGDVKAK